MKDKKEVVYNLLEKKDIRLTPQRDDILRVLLENKKKHLSAVDIYDLIKKKNKSMGMATVYRTLDLFEEKGIIIKRNFDSDFARYEFTFPEGYEHHHLICKNCGRVIEITDILPSDFKERILKEKGFQSENFSLKVYGYCEDCRQKKESSL